MLIYTCKETTAQERSYKLYFIFFKFEELTEMVAYGELTEAEAEAIAIELLKEEE